jgi:hypothetical protein
MMLLGVVLVLCVAGGAPAMAAPYPPSPDPGTGVVSPSGCAEFSGDGFAPGATVRISDNGASVGSAKADNSGAFTYGKCGSTKCGAHHLVGSGLAADGAARTVSLDLNTLCAVQTSNSPQVPSAPGGILPHTGVGWLLTAVVVGSLVTILGMILTAAGFSGRRGQRTRAS